MDLTYSLTLLASLLLGGLALALATVGGLLARRGREGAGRWLARARRASRGALALAAVSLTVHLAFGHSPGSPEALSPGAFLAVHPAFLVALALGGGGWAVARLAGRTVGRGDP